MSEVTTTPNKRRAHHDDLESLTSGSDITAARKRRAFLQTMGQQLREFGNEGTSPQDHGRTTFGTSPGENARPSSRAANVAASHDSAHANTVESDGAPGEDDQLPAGAAKSASKWLWRVNEVLPPSAGGVHSFVFDDLLDWSQSYFDYWHPAFPFLHAPPLLEYFRRIVQEGPHVVASSVHDIFLHVIVRSIMSISAADRRQMSSSGKPLPANLVFHSFNDAINSIQFVLTEESSILSLQALVSVQIFLISMHRYNAASRLEGLAVRMAFQLGLYRCPVRSQSTPSKEAELRKRLFWSIFCIDRYVCIRLGNPLGIRSDDLDVCYPHAERHLGTNEENYGHDDRLDLLDFLSRHASIRGSIMQTRHKSAMHESYDKVDQIMEMEADHTKWWNMVDEYLSNEDRAQPITKAHQVTLIVLRFETVLALHRSLLATPKKDSAYNAALQRCISASRSVINTLHKALKGFGAFDGSPGQHGYESTPLLWPSFTWAVWMSAFIIFSAASENEVPRDVALRLGERSVQILEHLALRGTSWPDACIVAIQNLMARLRGPSTRSSTVGPGMASDSRGSLDPSTSATHRMDPHRSRHTVRNQTDSRDLNQRQSSGRTSPRGPNTAIVPPGSFPNYTPNGYFVSNTMGPSHNVEPLRMPSDIMHNISRQDAINVANAHIASSGTFLGIAQQSSDNPLPNDEILHLFNGEDMAYWFGTDLGYGGNASFDDDAFH